MDGDRFNAIGGDGDGLPARGNAAPGRRRPTHAEGTGRMDGQRFDQLAKALAGGTSRRGALRGAAGGLAAALGLGARGARARQAKQRLCHATGDPANPYVVINVAKPAWETHVAHGDTPHVDCCVDADCPGGGTCRDGVCSPAAVYVPVPDCGSGCECVYTEAKDFQCVSTTFLGSQAPCSASDTLLCRRSEICVDGECRHPCLD